jgi:hypothetical protein
LSYRATIEFTHQSNPYLIIQSSDNEHSYEAVLGAIYSLVALLEFSNHKFDDCIIDNLKMRIEELRYP